METIAKFKDDVLTPSGEHITDLWVVGSHGAVSMWFSDTRSVLGHSVCGGLLYHSKLNTPYAVRMIHCQYLESACWHLYVADVDFRFRKTFDTQGDEAIYTILTAYYTEMTEWSNDDEQVE